MSNYWPEHPSPKGFSIERLAMKYREKITRISQRKTLPNLDNQIYNKQVNGDSSVSKLEQNYSHWANREFYEYYDAA